MTRSDISNLEKIPRTAKEEHYKRSRSCPKTKNFQLYRSKKAFVIAERGEHRAGLIPTQVPESTSAEVIRNLRKRRYSVDVNAPSKLENKRPKMTRAWAIDDTNDKLEVCPLNFARESVASVPVYNEAEPMRQRERSTAFPDPRRYWNLYQFDTLQDTDVPSDSSCHLDLPGSSINNEDFLNIRKFDIDGWLTDNSVDVPLELLSRKYKCQEHGIEIVQSLMAVQLYQIYRWGDSNRDNFAGYGLERERLSSSRHVFIPMNDGIDEISNEGSGCGLHWSFVYIDRELCQATYIDSLFAFDAYHQRLAAAVVDAMGTLLEEDYEFSIDWNSPDQLKDNRSPVFDIGPCGPFVIETIRILVAWIRGEQDAGNELDMIWLPDGFGEEYRFDSKRIREGIFADIARARMEETAKKLAKQHDEAALAGVKGNELEKEGHRQVEEASEPIVAGQESSGEEDAEGLVFVTPPTSVSSSFEADQAKIEDE
ncbi:hypothetical protein K491DRAFT_760677 [Lophiostoma macrostomum CBS 122681]|uniref:Ubiquitin-like protease family profile domain-containing protein n=1 Tax=Lophiostoma macrostomum CBS 122681 TaxID=1314788 RepID=A0A6A6T0B9_9PLEO|nr:hypothetical protein K491DRAFT_760677 [Lophiostoma macrostomum CBS 122681]